MHMGHSFGHLQISSDNLLGWNAKNYQRFLQSGVANWMSSSGHARLVPCCDTKIVGGDGSAIGIRIANVHDMKPVWRPSTNGVAAAVPSDEEFENKRMGRVGIQFLDSFPKADSRVARRNIRDMLSSGTSAKIAEAHWDKWRNVYCHMVPPEYANAVNRLAQLEDGPPRRHLRSFLRDSICESSVSYHVPHELLRPLYDLCFQLLRQDAVQDRVSSLLQMKKLFPLFDQGILYPAFRALHSNVACTLSIHDIVGVLRLLCEWICFILLLVVYIVHTVKGSERVWNAILTMPDPSHAPITNSDRGPYPPTDGWRSFFTEHGRALRTDWPIPKSAEKQLKGWETSEDGCSKLRTASVSRNQRSGLWIYTCMKHQTIVGFHVMGFAEGRRDCLLPLYKFKENPPEVIFCDTACLCEEAGMNWLPHFYKHTKFYHDIFHGYTHVCSGCFDSTRSPKYNEISTSLVEQCNSYLQGLRGVCRSGSMKLSTFMFWTEVFVTEWNFRKLKLSTMKK